MDVAGDALMARGPKGPPKRSKQENARQIAELAQMSRLAADLEAGKLPTDYAAKMLVQAEEQLGMRCGGCGRRITIGFEFTQLSTTVVDGIPTVDRAALSACNGGKEGDCDFAEKARPLATVVKMVEFAWLSPDPAVDPEAALAAMKKKPSPEADAGDESAAPSDSAPTEDGSASGEGRPSGVVLPRGVSG